MAAPYHGHQTPPFFKRGLPLPARLTIYVALALALVVADIRLRYLDTLRQGIAILTYPMQIAAATPAEFVRNISNYFTGLVSLERENTQLKAAQLASSKDLLRYRQLELENQQLRQLMAMQKRVGVTTTAAEILFSARDPFSNRVILDKGANHGIAPGLAAVDANGMIGQVTRVYPLHAEVTLLSDKDQAIPVVVARSGLRAVMFGTGTGLTELRFLAANAEVQPGDQILTSGLDGVFVAGLPVATVLRASRDTGESFGRIICKPIGGVGKAGAVLVLGRAAPLPQRPSAENAAPHRSAEGRISEIAADSASPPAAASAPASTSAPAAAVRPAPTKPASATAAPAPARSAPTSAPAATSQPGGN